MGKNGAIHPRHRLAIGVQIVMDRSGHFAPAYQKLVGIAFLNRGLHGKKSAHRACDGKGEKKTSHGKLLAGTVAYHCLRLKKRLLWCHANHTCLLLLRERQFQLPAGGALHTGGLGRRHQAGKPFHFRGSQEGCTPDQGRRHRDFRLPLEPFLVRPVCPGTDPTPARSGALCRRP